MASFLGDLAVGLRQAGRTLSPEVNQVVSSQEAADDQMGKQLGLMALQSRIAQNTPQAQAQLEALKNDKLFREAATKLEPGDYAGLAQAAATYGKPEIASQLYKAQEDRAARVAKAIDDNETKKTALEQLHETRLAGITNAEQRNAEIIRHNQMTEQLTQQNNSLNASLKQMGFELKAGQLTQQQDQKNNVAVAAFTNHMQQYKLPGLMSSITQANNLLEKYKDSDIPGFGVVTGSTKYPNVLRTEEQNNVRSAVQAVTNDLLNMYSGLAVTVPEEDRRALESMSRGDFTNADFKNAWPRIVTRFNEVTGNMAAGLSPEQRKVYESRPGAVDLKPIKPAFQKATAGPSIDDLINKYKK